MKELLIILVSTLFVQKSGAQDSLHFRRSTYKIIVATSFDNRTSIGYLSSISDTSVYISSLPVKFNGYVNPNSNVLSISYNQIHDIRLRRKESTTKGFLIGAIAGAA